MASPDRDESALARHDRIVHEDMEQAEGAPPLQNAPAGAP
jgi:hypothetical protein